MTQFYPSKCPEVAAKSIQSAIRRGQITQEDAGLIRTYISEYRAMKHVKEHRIHKTTYDLVNWRRFIIRPDTGSCRGGTRGVPPDPEVYAYADQVDRLSSSNRARRIHFQGTSSSALKEKM